MKKFEFASPAYIDELRRQLADAFAGKDLGAIEFTLSEEYTDPPKHLLAAGKSTIGFHLRLSGGAFEVNGHPLPNADVATVADYQSFLPFARHVRGVDPHRDAEFIETRKRLVAAGKIRTSGDHESLPAALRETKLHNRMAPLTL